MTSRRSRSGMLAALSALLFLPACSGSGAPMSPGQPASESAVHTLSGGGGPGGGGGGGGIPPPTVDGPAWFIFNASGSGIGSPNIDFDAIQNTVQGAIAIGATRTATELIYNTSKKTALTLTQIAIVGNDASDFTIPAADLKAALGKSVPPNKNQGAVLHVTYSPLAQGVRSGTLRLVSNAGTALISLTGTALPPQPVIVTSAGPLAFLPDSAPDTVPVSNDGGKPLVLQSISLGGSGSGAFRLTGANAGFGNCSAGSELGAHAYCYIGVGVASGAPVPSSATLRILSNDPVHPETDIALSLTQ